MTVTIISVVKQGGVVYSLYGAAVPSVLQFHDDGYLLIGGCSAQEIMVQQAMN